MSEVFDPYHRWLGIPAAEQPPNHYRLLGTALFENNPDVIQNAADQRMAHLRSFQTGERADLVEKLLNEVSSARVCLADRRAKADYDKHLRTQIAGHKARRKAVSDKTAAAAKKRPEQRKPAAPLIDIDTSPPTARGKTRSGKPKPNQPAQPKTQHSTKPTKPAVPAKVAIGVAAVLVVGLSVVVWAVTRRDEVADAGKKPEPEPTSKWVLPKPKPEVRNPAKTPPKKTTGNAKSPTSTDAKPTAVNLPRPAIDTKPDPNAILPKATPSDPIAEKPSSEPTDPEPTDPEPTDPVPSVETSPVEPETTEPEKRLPLPDTLAQQTALKQLREVFKISEAKTPEAKTALAKELLESGLEPNAPADRYVLLDQARQLAASADNVALQLEAIDGLDRYFEVDGLAMSADVVAAVRLPSRLKQENRAVANLAADLMDRAVDEEQFELAIKLGTLATSTARRIDDFDLARDVADRVKFVRQLAAAHSAIEKVLAALEENPDDAAANLEAGRYYCFLRQNWTRGLPYLARSGNAALASIARQELSPPTESSALLGLGSAWWELAQKSKDEEKDAMLRRAGLWYDEALPKLSRLERIQIERRMETIRALGPAPGSEPRMPAHGLVAYYAFDETSGDAVKDAAGTHEGKIAGAVRVRGHAGGGIRFDGVDDTIQVPKLQELLGGTASLAVWIKTTQRGVAQAWMCPGIAGFERPGETGDIFWGTLDPFGRMGVRCGNFGSAKSRVAVNDDQWHHVAMMRDAQSGQVAVAVDGELHGTNTSGTGVITTGFSTIGFILRTNGMANPTGFYAGMLDEMRIYNRILTEREIALLAGKADPAAIATASKPGKTNTRAGRKRRELVAPVVHWKLDEGSGLVANDSQGQFHGRIEGARWTEGVLGGALQFDGQNDYLAIPKVGTTEAFTLTMWVRPLSVQRKFVSLLHNDGWENRDIHVHLRESGVFSVGVKGLNTDQPIHKDGTSKSKARLGAWQHVAMAYARNAKATAIYIDGKLDASHVYLQAPPCQFGPGRIGGWNGAEARYFHGAIDDVRIYDRVLAPDDIAALAAEAGDQRKPR